MQHTDISELTQQSLHLLQRSLEKYNNVTLANSLSAEDMLITDLMLKHGLSVEVFVLDTGRLHEETYATLHEAQRHYGTTFKVYYPRGESVEDYVADHGINGFYDGVAQRQSCCFIRKVEPLRRALAGKDAWITGLRRQQSVTRTDLESVEWDEANGLHKISPLLNWRHEDVWSYIHAHNVPYNTLHDQGFPSIGCAPCTRPVALGEDLRSGRWWWESPASKECGLHERKVA